MTINWGDPEIVRAYKAGYMRGLRIGQFKPPSEATPLAQQLMLNRFMGAVRTKGKGRILRLDNLRRRWVE